MYIVLIIFILQKNLYLHIIWFSIVSVKNMYNLVLFTANLHVRFDNLFVFHLMRMTMSILFENNFTLLV